MSKDYLGIIPPAATVIGATIGTKIKLPNIPQAILLLVAIGFVTASMMIDLPPEVEDAGKGGVKTRSAFVLAMLGGVFLMVGLNKIEDLHHTRAKADKTKFPIALIGATCIDFFVDGLIIGQSLHGKVVTGMLVGASIEAIVITTGIISTMKRHGNSEAEIAVAAGSITASSLIGNMLGHKIGSISNPTSKAALYGLGVAAGLWMIVVELYPEANKLAANGKNRWWVPVVWIAAAVGGIVLDWSTEPN